jgi:hypothetical protein
MAELKRRLKETKYIDRLARRSGEDPARNRVGGSTSCLSVVGDVVTCKLSEVYDPDSGDSHLSRGLFLPTDEISLRRRNL